MKSTYRRIPHDELVKRHKSTQIALTIASQLTETGDNLPVNFPLGHIWTAGLLIGIGLNRFNPELSRIVEEELIALGEENGVNLVAQNVPKAIRSIVDGE